MDVQVGDVIQTKKPHPCGANRFDVLRVGMDFKIKCQGCGHEIMLPRAKIERNIKKVLRAGEITYRRNDINNNIRCMVIIFSRQSPSADNRPLICCSISFRAYNNQFSKTIISTVE